MKNSIVIKSFSKGDTVWLLRPLDSFTDLPWKKGDCFLEKHVIKDVSISYEPVNYEKKNKWNVYPHYNFEERHPITGADEMEIFSSIKSAKLYAKNNKLTICRIFEFELNPKSTSEYDTNRYNIVLKKSLVER